MARETSKKEPKETTNTGADNLKEEKNIDQLFKDRLEARNFELKASYITNLESKLDAQVKKKNRRNIFLLLLIIPIVIYFSYSAFTKNDYLRIVEETYSVNLENVKDETTRKNGLSNSNDEKMILKEGFVKRFSEDSTETYTHETKERVKKNEVKLRGEVLFNNDLLRNTSNSSTATLKKEKVNLLLASINVDDNLTNYKESIRVPEIFRKKIEGTRLSQLTKVETLDAVDLIANWKPQLANDSLLTVVNDFPSLEEEELNIKKWAFGIVFSPDYVFKTPILTLPNNYINFSKTGFTTGLSFKYKLNKKLGVETGLSFFNRGERWIAEKIDTTKTTVLPDPTAGFNGVLTPILSFSQRKIEVNSSYYYLGVPLRVNYYFLNKGVKLFLSGGISTSFLVDQKIRTTVEYEDGRIEDDIQRENRKDVSRINFSMEFGLGMDYQLTEKISLGIEPTFRRSLTSINNRSKDKEYFNSFGSNIGLYYRW